MSVLLTILLIREFYLIPLISISNLTVICNSCILNILRWDFIDTEEFQRLRNLKQLGNAYYVFPGASHTRFEHSIGTSYLSSMLLKILDEKIIKEFKPTYLEKSSIALAGLLHDLGHGPYSHLFDRMVIKYLQYVTCIILENKRTAQKKSIGNMKMALSC